MTRRRFANRNNAAAGAARRWLLTQNATPEENTSGPVIELLTSLLHFLQRALPDAKLGDAEDALFLIVDCAVARFREQRCSACGIGDADPATTICGQCATEGVITGE